MAPRRAGTEAGQVGGGGAHRRKLCHRRGSRDGLSNTAAGVCGLSGVRDQSTGICRNADHCSRRCHWRHAGRGPFARAPDRRRRRSRAPSALDSGNCLSLHVSGARLHTRAACLPRRFHHGADANHGRYSPLAGNADAAGTLAVGCGDGSRSHLDLGQSCLRRGSGRACAADGVASARCRHGDLGRTPFARTRPATDRGTGIGRAAEGCADRRSSIARACRSRSSPHRNTGRTADFAQSDSYRPPARCPEFARPGKRGMPSGIGLGWRPHARATTRAPRIARWTGRRYVADRGGDRRRASSSWQ